MFAATLGATAMTAAVGLLTAASAQADQPPAVGEYRIAGGPLGDVLAQFAATAGVQLVFDPATLAGMTSPGLQGRYGVREGFARLLAGHGYEAVVQSAGGYALRKTAAPPASSSAGEAITLQTVTVHGTAERDAAAAGISGYVARQSRSASKSETPLLQVPQSISVVTTEEIATRAAQSVTQAVAYTPGVVTGMFGPSTRDDYFQMRGFEGTQYLDGTRLMSSSSSYAQLRVEPYGMERVDVVRGPSSVLYGQNPPGGLVDMTSKRPTETPVHEIQLWGGSFGRLQGAIDLGGPAFGRDDLLFRVVALGRNSDTQVDFVEDDRAYFAPSITWKPTDATQITFLGHFQKDSTGNAMQFLPYEGTVLGNPNGRIPSDRFIGEPAFDGYEREQFALGYALEHRFDERLSLRQNLRYASVDSDYRGVYPDYFYGFDSDAGVLIPGGSFVDSEMTSILRYGAHYRDDADTLTVDTQLESAFVTGPVAHALLIGVDYRRFDAKRRRGLTDFELPELILNVYDPDYGVPFDRPALDSVTRQDQHQVGIYLQDRIEWSRWIATFGLRHDWASASTRPNAGDEVEQDERAFTFRAGLGYQFASGVVPYYSYAESFEPTPGTTFDETPFDPTTGTQHEFGIKYQPRGSNAFITAAVFHLEQRDVVTPDPDPGHVGYSVQTGKVRSRGFELEGKASLDIGLDLVASYTYTDTEVLESNIPAELGKKLTYTPEHQAALWLHYTLRQGALSGLGLGGGVRYASGNFGDLSNSLETPSYVLVDAALHYDLGALHARMKGMRLGVNVTNLLDRRYFTTCYGGNCFFGDRRTVLASLRYDW